MRNAVIVLRASTNKEKQANSIRIQREILSRFAEQHQYDIIEEYVEYASGKDDNRKAFNAAINRAREDGVFVLFYRADRLARSMSVWSKIQDILPQIRLAELGDTEPNLFVLGVLLAQATQESINISVRVSAAYKSIKEKNPDAPWGNPNMANISSLGRAKVSSNAAVFNSRIISLIDDLKCAGHTKTQAIVDRLNDIGVTTRRGKPWTYQNLYRLMAI